MRAVWLGGSTTAPSTSAVNYYALTGDLEHTPTTVELARSNVLTDDVEIISISAIVANAPGVGKSWTLKVRNAAGNTVAAVVVSGTNNSGQWNGSVTCLADTRVGLSITPSGTPAAIGSVQWVVTYQTAGNFYVALTGRTEAPSGTVANQYCGFVGVHNSAPTSSVTAAAELAPTGYTVTKLGMAMGSSTTLSGGPTLRCGKQGMATVSSGLSWTGADGNDAIGTLATPLHVNAGETAQLHLAPGSIAWNPYLFSATIVPDVIGEQILSYTDVVAPSTTVTQYVGPSGQNNGAWNATETVVAIRMPDCRVTKLYAQQVTAPGSGKSRDYALRQNGGYAGTAATVSGTSVDANDGGLNTITYVLGDQLSVEQKPTGTPAATAGVKLSLVMLIGQDVSGALAATMVAATASLNGQAQVIGVMAATMRAPTAALAGQNSQSGALAATMRTMAVALTGSQRVNGTMVASLRAAVAQLVGSGVASGTMALQMRRLIASLDGDTTSGEIAVTLRRLIASVNGSQTVRGVLAATLRATLFNASGSAGSQAAITASLRAPTAALVGIVVDVVAPPALPAVQFKVARAMPNPVIVSPTQVVVLRTAAGTQIAQYLGDQQVNLTWSREAKETSRCELTVQSDMTYTGRIPDIQPWAHWADVWDDTGQLLLWSGPVVKMVANRDQVVISARDISAFGSRTRVPITKRWDAIDPALVAGEMYRYMLEHHNLDAQAIVRPDPLGDRYDFKTTADDGQVDKVIEDLVGLGMTWTVVNGTPILGPVSRRPVASLGERDFVGGGLTITRDGTNSYNDILLRSGSDQARAIVPMGGLALQQTVDIDSVFGVSNTNKATLSYAQYVGKIRDMLSLSDGVVLHPAAPISIEELIPGARVFIEAYGIIFTMGLTRVEVTTSAGASQVSVGMEAVDDELPELVELQAKRYTGGADL